MKDPKTSAEEYMQRHQIGPLFEASTSFHTQQACLSIQGAICSCTFCGADTNSQVYKADACDACSAADLSIDRFKTGHVHSHMATSHKSAELQELFHHHAMCADWTASL